MLEPVAERSVFEPVDQFGCAPLVCPGRNDADQVVVAPRVRIDVRLDVDPVAPRLVDQADDLGHPAPERLIGDLEVDDVDRNSAPAADGDRFLDRGEDLGPFVADVRRIDARRGA